MNVEKNVVDNRVPKYECDGSEASDDAEEVPEDDLSDSAVSLLKRQGYSDEVAAIAFSKTPCRDGLTLPELEQRWSDDAELLKNNPQLMEFDQNGVIVFLQPDPELDDSYFDPDCQKSDDDEEE